TKKSLNKIYSIYTDIANVADNVLKSRCPYKDAKSRCTAMFSCTYQHMPSSHSSMPICTGSDGLDYRSAWEPSQR
ncbi:hypothetical protein M1N55_07330, partial [Dehalococcoidia bacterium]|nr:hypothetical protein [Dehalococcoidia bacterium]